MKGSFAKDFGYAMTPLKIMSWPMGTWPLQDYNVHSIVRAFTSVSILLLMVALVHTEIYLDSSNAEHNLDALVIGTCGVLAVAKVMCFRIWPEGLISNFTSAVKDYNELNSEENREIMRRHAYMSRVAFASVIFCSYFSATLFTVVSILVKDEEDTNVTREDAPDYPIPSGRTLAVINVPENYYLLVFVVEYLMLIVTSTGNLGSDSLFFGITFHVCGQVEILRMKFSRLKNEKEKTQEYFNLLTRRHIYLFDLAEMLNETISSILIVQLLSSCILICTSGFQFVLALSVGNVIMMVKTLLVFSTLFVQLFAYSYVGDCLKRQMEGIGNAAYSGKWIDMPKHMSKDIIYVIMRSQSPVYLTAGNFFIVNIETFMSIIKTSMSYISVLRVMKNTMYNIKLLPSKCSWQRTADIGTVTYPQWQVELLQADILRHGELSFIFDFLEHLARMKGSFTKDFNYAMTPLKIMSWPMGTWPLQDYNVHSIVRAFTSVSILLLMLALVHTEIYLDGNNAEANLDALVIGTCGVLAVAKVMCFRIWPEGLITNFTAAVKDYRELNNEESRKIMRRHAYMGRVAFANVIFCSYFGSTLFTVVSILVDAEEEVKNVTEEDIKNYPIPSKNTLAVINVPDNYYLLIFVVEYLMLIVTSTGNLGSDSLFFGITFHVCGQIEVLQMEFSKLKNEEERTQEHFTLLVKRHIYLLDLAEMLKETISSILMVQLASSCILICTSGFQFIVALNVGNVIMVVKTLLVFSALLVQLFAYSYVGDYLKLQVEGIGNAAYSSKWFDMPSHCAKDIIYVIMKSQRPVHLTAGNFFIVNIETYMSIIKTSMSYLSVLRVMLNA